MYIYIYTYDLFVLALSAVLHGHIRDGELLALAPVGDAVRIGFPIYIYVCIYIYIYT